MAILAVIGGGVRAVHLWEIRDSPRWRVLIGDAARYHDWAMEIADGDWLGSETFYQAPLYPYWLGGLYTMTGPDPAVARGVQAGLGVVSCLLLAMAGRRCFGPRAGWIAGLLLALWPAELFHESLLEKSGPTTCLVCGWLLLVAITWRNPGRTWGWFAAGGVLGLLTLVRENALILLPLMGLWIAFHPRSAVQGANFDGRRRRVAAISLGLGLMIPLAPVLVRNRIVGGEWQLTTAQFGPNFYIGNSSIADGTYQELVPEHGTPEFEQDDACAMAESAVGRSLSPGEVSRWWTARTLSEIQARPGRWLRLLLQKIALTWSNVEIADSEDQYTAARESRLLGGLMRLFPFGLLAGLSAAGLYWLGSYTRRVWILPAYLAVYTASLAAFYLFARYRLPLVPPLALLAGVAIARGITLIGRGAKRPLAVGFACGLAAAAATSPALVGGLFPDWPELSIDAMRGITEYNLAMRQWEHDAPNDEVASHFEASTKLNPGYASAWLCWGGCLRERGEHREAAAKLLRAAECDPEGADIRCLLGETLMLLRQPQAARAHLLRAVELSPEDSQAHLLLGRASYLLADWSSAERELSAAMQIDPDSIAARRLLAMTLDRMGRSADSDREFETLLKQIPAEHPEAAAIRRRLRRGAAPLPD